MNRLRLLGKKLCNTDRYFYESAFSFLRAFKNVQLTQLWHSMVTGKKLAPNYHIFLICLCILELGCAGTKISVNSARYYALLIVYWEKSLKPSIWEVLIVP